MNRTAYFSYIEEKLGILAYRINQKGKINILDLHIHSENFYFQLLNCVYGWDLNNLNAVIQNVESIDLIDHTNKFILQVSATNTKQKVELTLKKDIFKRYPAYFFKFVSISNDARDLRKITFINPHNVIFNPTIDIIDNNSILNSILSFNIDRQKEVYELIKKELGGEIDMVKLDSNLALIINLLSQEQLSQNHNFTLNAFEIDRKIKHNNLIVANVFIEDCIVFIYQLNKKYKELDAQGSNKSLAVLQSIKKNYVKALSNGANRDNIFFEVLESVKENVIQSANYVKIPIDELELCVNIIVVDAFVRCKIFENPENYNYATP